MIAEEIQDEYENLHLDIEELIESPIFFENDHSLIEKNSEFKANESFRKYDKIAKNRPFC
jgi:hypothetical protein